MVVDVILDARVSRALGLEVLCGERARRYLPLAACDRVEGKVRVESALVLLSAELDFYRAHGSSFANLRGRAVRRGPLELGVLRDLVLVHNGALAALLIGDRPGHAIPPDPLLTFGPDALRRAV